MQPHEPMVPDTVHARESASASPDLGQRNARPPAPQGESIHWGICLRGSDELKDVVIGSCGFYRGFPDGVGEIGYVLAEPYRGMGIMRAAVELVVRFGFEQLHLSRIVAYTDRDNLASISVLQHSGFVATPSSRDDSLQFERARIRLE